MRDSQSNADRRTLPIVLLIALFALLGIGIVAGGCRSRVVACNPVCAKCGYDLRGYAIMTRCSECGGDLHTAGAVRSNTLRIDREKIIRGLLVIALPWMFLGSVRLVEFAKPRLRTNRSVIADIDKKEKNFDPMFWNELARRLACGRLRNPEATAAVDQFIAYLHHQYNGHSMVWEEPFYTAADRAGVISGPQYLEIAQTFYGRALRINLPAGLSTSRPSQFWISIGAGQNGELPGEHRAITVQEISMSGPSATTQEIIHRAGQGTMLPPDINLLTASLDRLAAAQVPSGKYNLKFVAQIRLMPGTGQTTISILPIPGPAPLAQWTEAITMPVWVNR